MDRDKDSLKNIEVLLEKLLEELIIESTDKDIDLSLHFPIPAKIFIEMEEIIGKRINFIGLS